MLFSRFSLSSFRNPSSYRPASSPILAILAVITIGGSMCFVAGGLFLFSAISLHQGEEEYTTGFLILFVGFVILATCYFAWVLTSHGFDSPDRVEDTSDDTIGKSQLNQLSPPSYNDAVRNCLD